MHVCLYQCVGSGRWFKTGVHVVLFQITLFVSVIVRFFDALMLVLARRCAGSTGAHYSSVR